MNPNLLAEIYVGKKAPDGKTIYEFATGHPIGHGRVITAAHVLLEGFESIEVCFRNSKNDRGVIPADLQWDGRPRGFDIAVLKCEFPEDISWNQCIGVSEWGSIESASALGYPRLQEESIKRDARGNREVINFPGTPGVLENISSHFRLMINTNLLDKRVGWKGISGGPVFVGPRLVGIIEEYLNEFEVACFRVAPVCRLLAVEGFPEAISLEDESDQAWRRTLRDKVREIIERIEIDFPGTTRDLWDELEAEMGTGGKPPDGNLAAALADRLVQAKRLPELACIVEIHSQLAERHYEAGVKRAFAEMVELIAPLHTQQALFLDIIGQIRDKRTALVVSGMRSTLAVEVLLARIDRSALLLKTVRDAPKPQRFQGRTSVVSEVPREGRPGMLPVVILRYLCKGFSGEEDEPSAGFNVSEETQRWAERLKGILEGKLTGKLRGRKPYCILVGPADSDLEALDEAVKKIKSHLNDLHFVTLSSHSADEETESLLGECFRRVYHP